MFLARSLLFWLAGQSTAVLLVACTASAWSTDVIDPIDVPRAVALTLDEEDASQLGWIQHFEVEGTAASDYRLTRMAALFVPQDASATPFLPAGPFRLTMSGWLDVELPGRFAFRAVGHGLVTITINDVTVLDRVEIVADDSAPLKWTRLSGGRHRLKVEYVSPANGDARLRLLWRGETFAEEPLPPEGLFHDSRHAALVAQKELRRGRELIGELHCLRCHAHEQRNNQAHLADMGRTAPSLRAAGERFEQTWLFHWLLDPEALRDEARMPQVLTGLPVEEQRQAAADIAALLTAAAPPATNATTKAEGEAQAADRGRLLFDSLGCISCHRLSGAADDNPYQRISLATISRKYRKGQLALFLRDPQRDDAWRTMPNFALTPQEAQDLESFLRAGDWTNDEARVESALPSPPEFSSADAARGAAWLGKLGCIACHGSLTDTELDLPIAADLGPALRAQAYSSGCLADHVSAPTRAPQFRLSPSDLASLRRFVATGMAALGRDDAAETAELMIRRLRCNHCHQRDDLSSVWPEVMAEEGSQGQLPETVPSLTWAGEKLQVDWARRILSGDVAARARPWLHIRMPSYPAYAERIAIGLARQHGFSADARLGPLSPPEQVELGKRLAGREEGFFCIECHAVGSQAAIGAFSHHGVNLDQVGRRLNYDYYLRWITNPTRVDAGTKMPTFSPDGQRTAKTQILDGHAQAQFQAIWHYVRSLSHEDTNEPNLEASRTRAYNRSDQKTNLDAE